ncbi:PREDICTED: spermatogenesis associated 6-like protein [Condylura cristata]|uniref:spermatogenesis associated 6-like protein n=1 Tax=Condylura cristata TaxID=143302 RepID=UPI0003344A20|nr:PREDICTED: spermatogenesis associated 6-like protein [Condylura cristata]
MPLEVVVELQVRAISCPGVFLPGKQDVYLGIYFLNQYLETECFPPVFPLMIQQNMKFEKGIAPKLEFYTRTAIRECAFLHEDRFIEERYKSQKPVYMSYGSKFHIKNLKMKPKESYLDRLPQGMQSGAPSLHSTSRFLQDQPAQLNLRNNFKSKPPFVVRHVDSANPFGENISDYHSRKSRRKSNFSDFPYLMKRASSLDSLAANVKVIKEPDERIILKSESPSTLDSSKSGKPSPSYSNQGKADFHQEASFANSQHSRSPSPLLDQPLLRERFHPSSHSTWKKIHERVCSLLTSHRAQKYLNKEDSIYEVNDIFERPRYPVKKYPVHEDRYF